MSWRRYQVVLFERENPDDKYIYGVIRWEADSAMGIWLGEYQSREEALIFIRREMELDNHE